MTVTYRPIWDPANALRLPELSETLEADVCVVGLGGSGLACTRELLAYGKRVVGVDAASIAAGAAGANGGFLLGGLAMFHHDAVVRLGREPAVALYQKTLEQIERMATETGGAIRRVGSLRIAASPEELLDCDEQLEAMRQDGLPVERYGGEEGKGLLFPDDAAFDPGKRCQILATDALARGARLFERSPMVSVDNHTVTTPRGAVRAEDIVIAVDGKLDVVLPELASRVRSARLQMLATAPDSSVRIPRPVYSRWGLDYWQQRADGCVVIGGGRDVGGDAEWTTDTRPTLEVQESIERLLRDRVGSCAPITHRWAATVAYTPSGLPVLEQVHPGVWAIGGYCGTGNVIGALCGRAVAESIARGRSDLAALLRA